MSTMDQFGHQVAAMVEPGETQTFRSENIGIVSSLYQCVPICDFSVCSIVKNIQKSFVFPVIEAKSVPTDTETPVVFGVGSPKTRSSGSNHTDAGMKQGILLEAETIDNIAEGKTIPTLLASGPKYSIELFLSFHSFFSVSAIPGDHLLIWSSHYTTLSDLLPESEYVHRYTFQLIN